MDWVLKELLNIVVNIVHKWPIDSLCKEWTTNGAYLIVRGEKTPSGEDQTEPKRRRNELRWVRVKGMREARPHESAYHLP